MQTSWSRTFLLALLPLSILFSGHGAAQASAHSTKQPTSKKATHSPQAKKASAKKTSAIAKRTTIVHRKNLRAAVHTGATASGMNVVLHQPPRDDIVIKRPNSANSDFEPLTSGATLRSEVAFVQDLESSAVLYDKNSDEVRPIASISKLMTALIIAEAGQPMDQMLEIDDTDVDRVRHSRSRLQIGSRLSRADMLHLALMSSENRAAHALARYYPGGMPAFIRAMNDKARSLGMRKTHFVEPTGLSSDNVSTPRDLVKLLRAANRQPLIHRYTTSDRYEVEVGKGRQLVYNNTNRLVSNANWDIQISKTGFINEAGECLVMLARIGNRETAIILLNSTGRYSRIGDAVRIRTLVEKNETNLAML